MDNLSYLFAAYSIIFAAIVLYVMFLWRRQSQLNTRLRGLELELQQIRRVLSEDRTRPVIVAPRSIT